MALVKENFTTPQILRCANGTWYVFFKFFDQKEGKYMPVKRSENLNRIKDKLEKEAEFKALRDAREAWLKMGWNPLTDPDFKQRDTPGAHQVQVLKELTFDQALDFAYKKKLPDWSKKTGQDYASKIKYFKESAAELYISQMRVTEVKRPHLRMLLEKIKEVRQLTAAGYNIYRDYLSSLFGELEQWEVIEYNPVEKIKTKDAVQKIVHRPPTPEEQKIIITRIKADFRPYYRFLSILYGCTIRPKEICALKVKDLRRAEQIFRLIPGENSQDEHRTTKTKKERDVVVPDWVMELLAELNLQNCNPEWYIFSGKGKLSTFMPGPKRMHSNTPTRWWREIVKCPVSKGGLGLDVDQYGLKKMAGDDLVKIQVQHGVDKLLDLPKQQMGHADTRMTEVYTQHHKEVNKELIKTKMPVL